ncbi:MAG: response regulator, partial [Deltaproteobacteria bacterium]|nr:response regulator [Deltaproteobacteria bacterium]
MAKVLVIESEAAVAQALSDALAQQGHQAVITSDGGEALKLAADRRPELIILCVELARGSGYSVCNKLKKDADLASVPLILTSSQATDET